MRLVSPTTKAWIQVITMILFSAISIYMFRMMLLGLTKGSVFLAVLSFIYTIMYGYAAYKIPVEILEDWL